MSLKRKQSKGFTLIELMIVVAIIGILAAIAIPNFVKYQLRSKFSEGATNVEGLRKAEEALRQGERKITINGAVRAGYTPGQYWNLGGASFPGTLGHTQKTAWTAGATGELATAQALDWMVEGSTYFQYQVAVLGGAGNEAGISWAAGAVADIDGDNTLGGVALVRPDLTGNVIANAPVVTFPGNLGSCVDSAGNTIYGMPCTTTGPDIF